MPANQYGKEIKIEEANEQIKLRDDLKQAVSESNVINYQNIKEPMLRETVRRLYSGNNSINGFVFERKYIQRFFESPFWADYLVVYEACSTSGAETGNPVVCILPVRYKETNTNNEDLFEIIDVKSEPNDATEHPGTPIIKEAKKMDGPTILAISKLTV